MAIVTCLLGLQYGHVIVHFKVPLLFAIYVVIMFNLLHGECLIVLICADLTQEHKKRLSLWTYPSMVFMLLGLLCHILGMNFCLIAAYKGLEGSNESVKLDDIFVYYCSRDAYKQGDLLL